jgi:hypothetical protein
MGDRPRDRGPVQVVRTGAELGFRLGSVLNRRAAFAAVIWLILFRSSEANDAVNASGSLPISPCDRWRRVTKLVLNRRQFEIKSSAARDCDSAAKPRRTALPAAAPHAG